MVSKNHTKGGVVGGGIQQHILTLRQCDGESNITFYDFCCFGVCQSMHMLQFFTPRALRS